MKQSLILRLLGVGLILAMGFFGVHAVAHWHMEPAADQHCQACHLGHALSIEPAAPLLSHFAIPVARFSPPAELALACEAVSEQRSPRAPPA
jgi:hypothetical protein